MNRSKTGASLLSLLLAIAAAAALTSLLAARSAPPVDQSADAKLLTKLDDDWSKAAATKDAQRVAAFYADDATAYPPGEPAAVGRQAAQKVWAAYFAMPEFSISWKTLSAEVAASGDIGYTSGTYEDSFQGPDGKKVSEVGKYLCVWKKQKDGSWKAIRDMWNADSR